MGDDILGYLRNEIYSRCKKPANKFGMGCWYHIEAVVKNGELLAQKYGASQHVNVVVIVSESHNLTRGNIITSSQSLNAIHFG